MLHENASTFLKKYFSNFVWAAVLYIQKELTLPKMNKVEFQIDGFIVVMLNERRILYLELPTSCHTSMITVIISASQGHY